MKLLLSFLVVSLFSLTSIAQSLTPKFAPFKGKVIEMPEEWRPKGYAPFMEDLPSIQEIEWRKLDVKDRPTEEPFEDIKAPFSFGIIFNTTLKIDTPAYYYFTLISDDGSVLWIEDFEVLNNDGDHKMRMVSDTIALDNGVYKVKLWYYQAFALRYGLVFDYGYVKPIQINSMFFTEKSNVTDDLNIFFKTNSHAINNQASVDLDNFIKCVQNKKVSHLQIIGYADPVGNEQFNLKLSQMRAEKVRDYINSKINNIDIEVKAMGESKYKNEVNNYAFNRRVEIKVDFKRK